jgi:hypothetical protein
LHPSLTFGIARSLSYDTINGGALSQTLIERRGSHARRAEIMRPRNDAKGRLRPLRSDLKSPPRDNQLM